MSDDSEPPILTKPQLREWRAELFKLQDERRQLEDRYEWLLRRIRVAETIIALTKETK